MGGVKGVTTLNITTRMWVKLGIALYFLFVPFSGLAAYILLLVSNGEDTMVPPPVFVAITALISLCFGYCYADDRTYGVMQVVQHGLLVAIESVLVYYSLTDSAEDSLLAFTLVLAVYGVCVPLGRLCSRVVGAAWYLLECNYEERDVA